MADRSRRSSAPLGWPRAGYASGRSGAGITERTRVGNTQDLGPARQGTRREWPDAEPGGGPAAEFYYGASVLFPRRSRSPQGLTYKYELGLVVWGGVPVVNVGLTLNLGHPSLEIGSGALVRISIPPMPLPWARIGYTF